MNAPRIYWRQIGPHISLRPLVIALKRDAIANDLVMVSFHYGQYHHPALEVKVYHASYRGIKKRFAKYAKDIRKTLAPGKRLRIPLMEKIP